MNGPKVKMTPEDREALRLYYKPLPADHPLRNKIFFHSVPKRDESKTNSQDLKQDQKKP